MQMYLFTNVEAARLNLGLYVRENVTTTIICVVPFGTATLFYRFVMEIMCASQHEKPYADFLVGGTQ
jgi:hypothetical protein